MVLLRGRKRPSALTVAKWRVSVGYKRINKKTGKEIAREQIVKGIECEDGQSVVLSDAEISAAYPKTTQTIEIEAFVPGSY